METRKNGTNKEIGFGILSDKEMKNAGFRLNENKTHWLLLEMIKFPKEMKCLEISLWIYIPVNGDDESFNIQVIDEDFGQPYDFQFILSRNPFNETALIVQTQVEQIIDDLQKSGIIYGHVKGAYI